MVTFVIVPGGCTPASLFDNFCNIGKSQGINAIAVQLPSVGQTKGQPGPTNNDDVKAICDVVEPLLDNGEDVVLVTSSLGGVIGTQSLEYLSAPARAARGKIGSVAKIIYVTSMVLEFNTSPMDFFGERPPRYMTSLKDNEEYIHWTDDIDDGTKTFSDMPQDEARRLRRTMDEYHSRHSFESKLTYPGYNHAEVHYVLCRQDHVLPEARQLKIIADIESWTRKQVPVHPLEAGHLPFVTRPKATLELLQKIVQS